MTAVVETSMQQPPVPVSSWARRITDWETRNDGKLWQCRLIGEHHGAEVVQYVQAHWFGPATVDLDAVEDPTTGQFSEVSITTPDRLGPVTAATARQVAEALMQAADLLDGGQR